MTLADMERLRMNDDTILPDAKVRQRYGVCSRTIARWERDPQLGFPAALIVNHRKYRRLAELQAWELSRISGKAEVRDQP
jgi:hypothetical protein